MRRSGCRADSIDSRFASSAVAALLDRQRVKGRP